MDLPNFTKPEDNIAMLGLHEGLVVADLGSGTGAYTILLARKVGETGRVYAVEVQKEFLSNIKTLAAENGLKNIEVIWGDIERPGGTKIKDDSVDAVVVSNVLFQAEDKPGLVREAKRILKTGGKLLFIDWSASFKGMGPTESMIIPKDIARDLFKKEGFVLTKDFQTGDHHYGLLMVKL